MFRRLLNGHTGSDGSFRRGDAGSGDGSCRRAVAMTADVAIGAPDDDEESSKGIASLGKKLARDEAAVSLRSVGGGGIVDGISSE